MNWLLIALVVIQAVEWPIYCLRLVRRIRRAEGRRRREWVREACLETRESAALKAIHKYNVTAERDPVVDAAIKRFFEIMARAKRVEIDATCERLLG